MRKLYRKLRARLYRRRYEAWKQQCYHSTDGIPESITVPYFKWMEEESGKIFEDGGPKAVEEARLEWFRVLAYLPYVHLASIGYENEMVELVFKDQLSFLDSIFVYREEKIIHGFYVGNGDVAVMNSHLVLGQDEPVYRKKKVL
jgi:hypothetical protein